MRRVVLFILLSLLSLWRVAVFAQVTIGSITPPHPSAVLEVISPDNDKGVLVPKMTTEQRDAIGNAANGLMIFNTDENCFNFYDGTSETWISLCNAIRQMSEAERDDIIDPPNGLLIFNTDENCYNFYNTEDAVWNSVCGGTSLAKGDVDCQSAQLNGTLTEGTPVNSSNYLTVPVHVTKAGVYFAITATPEPANGYYFTASGSFPKTGYYSVNLLANGVPTKTTAADKIVLTFDGDSANCVGLTIPVGSPIADYTIVDVKCVPGTFPVDISLSPEDYYLNVTLNVKNPGQWVLTSTYINGYSFSAIGNISQASGYNPGGTFPQTVIVTVPVTPGSKALNIGNSKDEFLLSSLSSKTPSSFPFTVNLADVEIEIDNSPSRVIDITAIGDFIQNVPLSDQEILLPIHVIIPGTNEIYAIGSGMKFTSGKLYFDTQKQIVLTPVPGSVPLAGGRQELTIGCEHGVATKGSVFVDVVSDHAVIDSIFVVYVTPNSHNYIIDANGNTPATVTLRVTSSTAGAYNLSSETINGVRYEASGVLMALGTHQDIILTPKGNPEGVVGTKTYTIEYNGKAVSFDVNFVYRAMKILGMGGTNYNLSGIKDHINTSANSGKANFGVNGKVPTAGITLTSTTTAGAGELAKNLNSGNYDIVFAGYGNNSYNANDVIAAVNFVNSGGVLFLATEGGSNATTSTYGNSVRSILSQLFETSTINYNNSSSSTWYTANSYVTTFIAVDSINEPILNGPFGDIRGKYLGNDNNLGNLLAGNLPPKAIPLSTPLSNATPSGASADKSWFAIRHKDLGFVWAGDGGFSAARTTTGTEYWYRYPVLGSAPSGPINWLALANDGISPTSTQVYNGQFMMNFFAYAIKYVGTYEHK